MKFLALAFLLTALVGAAPAERNAEALEARDALTLTNKYASQCWQLREALVDM